jgi:hypothetical protein
MLLDIRRAKESPAMSETINDTAVRTADRMKSETEQFLERAAKSPINARRAYERFVRKLHKLPAPTFSPAPRMPQLRLSA